VLALSISAAIAIWGDEKSAPTSQRTSKLRFPSALNFRIFCIERTSMKFVDRGFIEGQSKRLLALWFAFVDEKYEFTEKFDIDHKK
jgi:hypothetical protein